MAVVQKRGRGTKAAVTDIRARYGLVFAWAIVIVGFSIAVPDTFPQFSTLSGILGSQAPLIFLSLAVVIPLTAGDYDLSIAGNMSATAMLLAVLNVKHDVSIGLAVLIALAFATLIGLLNAFLIVRFRINPFIVTLGVGTALNGVSAWLGDSGTVTGTAQQLSNWVIVNRILGIPIDFYYGVALVLICWYLLDFTSLGRRLLYVGLNTEVARLSGVRIGLTRGAAFVMSGFASGIAGVIYVGMTSSAAPSSGNAYLLPAYAAAFLGATAISPGRFNALGTVIAVYFLVTGVTGLTFIGAQSYIQDVFYGSALVIAVVISQLTSDSRSVAKFRRHRAETGEPAAEASPPNGAPLGEDPSYSAAALGRRERSE